MGVYIDMEMPQSCHVCVAGYGGCCYVAPPEADGICPDSGRAEFCPLVPVPPHGRLIDADETIGHLFNGEQCLYSWDEIEEAVDATTTIIPADPAEEGE